MPHSHPHLMKIFDHDNHYYPRYSQAQMEIESAFSLIEPKESFLAMDALLFIQSLLMSQVCLLAFFESSWIKNIFTLLIKSAAYNDQLGGTYYALIWTCLLNIWSLISFLFLPLYGLLPSISSYAIIPTA